MTLDVTAPDGTKFQVSGDHVPNSDELKKIHESVVKQKAQTSAPSDPSLQPIVPQLLQTSAPPEQKPASTATLESPTGDEKKGMLPNTPTGTPKGMEEMARLTSPIPKDLPVQEQEMIFNSRLLRMAQLQKGVEETIGTKSPLNPASLIPETPQLPAGDSEAVKRIAGVGQALGDVFKTLGSPETIIETAPMAAPGMVGKVARGVVAFQMAVSTEEAVKQLGEEYGKPPSERDLQKIYNLMTQIPISALAAAGIGGKELIEVKRAFNGELTPAQIARAQEISRRGTLPEATGAFDPKNILLINKTAPLTGDALKVASQGLPAKPISDEMLAEKPSKPVVPETPAENRESLTDEIRRNKADTVAKIQQLYPQSNLTREQARVLRDAAWGKKEGEQNASSKQKATEVHGDMRPQPVEGAGQVPVAQSSGRIQPQAEKIPEASAPLQRVEPIKPEVKPATGEWQPAIRLMPTGEGEAGEVITGKPGQSHNDIIDAHNIPADEIDQRGFVNPKGEWKDREEAAQESKLPTAVQPGRLHSSDLPEKPTEPTPKGFEAVDYSEADLARYNELKAAQAEMSSKGQIIKGDQFTPEWMDNMKEFEALRNKYGGMPPRQLESSNAPKSAKFGNVISPNVIQNRSNSGLPPLSEKGFELVHKFDSFRPFDFNLKRIFMKAVSDAKNTNIPENSSSPSYNILVSHIKRYFGIPVSSGFRNSEAALSFKKSNNPMEVAINNESYNEVEKLLRQSQKEFETPKVDKPAEAPTPSKFKIGASPQTYSLVEKLEQTKAEKANGEQPVVVKNDKTGEESTVLESDLKAVKASTEPKVPKQTNADKLKALGYSDMEISAMSKDEQKALEARGEKKPAKAATPAATPKKAIEKVETQVQKVAPEMKGMGGAVPSEFASAKTPTSIKNATVDAERAKRGLPPAMQPARKDFGKVWDEAMAEMDKDPTYVLNGKIQKGVQDRLVDELRDKPRALTDKEDAMLLHRQIDLQNEYGKATRELALAVDDAKEFPNRAADVVEWKQRVARISDELYELYEINKRSGTETGRGLNARKMMAYEDYSLAAMETRLRAAKGGDRLTVGEQAEIGRISKRIDKAQKAIEDYQKKVQSDSTSPRLRALKKRYANRIEELSAKMAAGDFSPKERNPLVLDSEAMKLKAEFENAKLQFDRMAIRERLRQRTPIQWMQDTFVKWRRAFLLSSPVTLAKLTSAAIERVIITPSEEIVGGIASKLPVISSIAAKAPREGGFSVKAEALSLTEGITKGMSDAAKTLKTGRSDLDAVFGKRDIIPRETIDFIGQIHGALKAPVKRAEFRRSLQKRLEFAIRHGQDASDPLVQSRIMVEAYKDAQRSIFMQDNAVTSAFNMALRRLETPDKSGNVSLGRKTLASAAKVVFPIVKVPTNIIAETLQYVTGSVTGSVRLGMALKRGVETLKPEEADLIMRELKKGSLGAAFLLTGFFAADSIGGYYQPNDKSGNHPKFGTLQIAGVNIPTYLIHNPLLETLQIGATIRHVADAKLRKRDQDSQGVGSGIMAAGLGLVEEVPFVNEPVEFTRMFNPYERTQFENQFARDLIVPLGVKWVAEHFDKDADGNYIARDPQTFWQSIESAIPGLRQNVPEKQQKRK